MTDNQQGVAMFVVCAAVVFAVTALVGPFWLAVVLAGAAAGLATFAIGRIGRREDGPPGRM
jgi:hypothetical protein